MQHSDQPPKDTGHDDEAYTVSAILRGAREASGESLDDVAQQSRISRRYLEALEEGRFSELPGNTYTLGFIRTYASHLDLDSAELVNRYKAATENAPNKTKLDFPEPLPETGIPGGTILFAGILVAVVAYGGWYLATEEENSLANLVAPVPDRLVETVATAPNPDLPEQPTISDPVDESVDESVVTDSDDALAETSEEEQTGIEESASVLSTGEAEAVTEVVQEVNDAPDAELEQVIEIEDAVGTVAEVNDTADEIQSAVGQNVGEPVETEITAVETAEQPAIVDDVTGPVVETHADEPESQVADQSESIDERNARLLNEAQLRALQESMGDSVEDDIAQATTEEAVAEAIVEPVVNDQVETDTEIAASTSDAQEITPVEPRAYGEDGSSRIIITATTSSWAEVRDTISGELLLTRLLRTGDSFRVPNRPGISLNTGNAGGLEIAVDGQVVPPIGGSGDVRKGVSLDPELLKSGSAAN